MSDRSPECAAAAARAALRPPAAAPTDEISATAAQTPATSTAVADAASAPVAPTVSGALTAAPVATSSSTDSSVASGAGTGGLAADSAAEPVPTATADAKRLSTAPPPAIGSASSAAASCSSSSSSSFSCSTSPALKKCACCDRLLPDGDYSGAQLKAKGKRQCKVCVAEMQDCETELRHSGPDAAVEGAACSGPDIQVHEIFVRLTSSLESDQLVGFYAIIDALRELESSELKNRGANLSMNTETVLGVLHTAREAPTEQIRELAIECIALMSCRSTLRAQMMAAGVVPLVLGLLQLREPALTAIETVQWSLDAIERIAKASRVNCDALLASGTLAVLLPLVRSNIPAALGERLLSALACLMRGKPVAEMGAVVSRIGSVLMDRTSTPEILRACINTFGQALEAFASEDPNRNSWVESILSAAPGVPQRLVDLLVFTRPDVAEITQSLMISVFCAETNQLRQLFDCGLADQLLTLLNHAGNRKARLRPWASVQQCGRHSGLCADPGRQRPNRSATVGADVDFRGQHVASGCWFLWQRGGSSRPPHHAPTGQ